MRQIFFKKLFNHPQRISTVRGECFDLKFNTPAEQQVWQQKVSGSMLIKLSSIQPNKKAKQNIKKTWQSWLNWERKKKKHPLYRQTLAKYLITIT